MKYKVTITLNEGDPHEVEITAKTKLAIKMKVNKYQERKGIDEEDVKDVTWVAIGEPNEGEEVL